MDISKYVGEKIKYFRTKKGITQQELGEFLNTTSQTISRYESGVLEANHNIIFKLADYFKVSVNDFFPPLEFDSDQKNIDDKKIISSNYRNAFANNLRNIRKSKNISQNELAKLLNTSQFIIAEWESAKLSPNLNNLVDIADVLQVNVSDLTSEDLTSIESSYNELDSLLFSKAKELNDEEKRAIIQVMNAIHKEIDKELDNK